MPHYQNVSPPPTTAAGQQKSSPSTITRETDTVYKHRGKRRIKHKDDDSPETNQHEKVVHLNSMGVLYKKIVQNSMTT
jgi:hypothetical protein